LFPFRSAPILTPFATITAAIPTRPAIEVPIRSNSHALCDRLACELILRPRIVPIRSNSHALCDDPRYCGAVLHWTVPIRSNSHALCDQRGL